MPLPLEQQLMLERFARGVNATSDISELRKMLVEAYRINLEMQNNYKEILKKEWKLDRP